MGSFSIWHWLVVLAVIVLVFGTKKLRNLGGDLGAAVRGFKQGMKEKDDDDADKLDDAVTANAVETSATKEEKTGTSS